MGKIEDEFSMAERPATMPETTAAPQKAALLRAAGAAPEVQELAKAPQVPRLFQEPPPSAGDRLRAQAPRSGLQAAIAERAPAAQGASAIEQAAYRSSLPQSPNAGLADTIAARAPAVAAPVAEPATIADAGVRARLTQQAPSGAGLAQTMAERAAPAPQAPPSAPAAPEGSLRARLAQTPPPGNGLADAMAARTPAAAPAAAPASTATRPAAPVASAAPQPGPLPHKPWDTNVNPNVAKGTVSSEAAAYMAERAAAPSGAAPAPAPAPTGRAGMAARIRAAAGLGDAAAAAAPGAVPPAAPATPAAPAGGIRGAAQSALGSGQQWGEFGSKVGQKAMGAAKVLGKVAKPLAAPLGAMEMVNGLAEGDGEKAAWGAADATAGAALWSPAAPAAAVYLTGRGAWEGGKMAGEALPETVRDGIGSGINKLVRGTGKIFGADWGLDEKTEASGQAFRKQMSIEQAARDAAAKGSKTAPTPAKAAPAAAPVAAPAADAPVSQQQAPTPGDNNPGAQGPTPSLIARYRELEEAQMSSPIAYTLQDGKGTHIYFKDGTLSSVADSREFPQELIDFNARHRELRGISSGAMTAPTQPTGKNAPSGLQLANLAGNQKVLADSAAQAGYDPARALMIASIETGGKFNADAKNPNSTAFGLLQMTKANRDTYGLSDEEWQDPTNQASTGIQHMMKTDAALTKRLGRDPSPAESYMGHLFGASGAGAVLSADPNASILDVVSSYDKKNAADIVKHNGMTGMTVQQAIQKWTALAAKHMPQGGAPGAAPAQNGTTLADLQEMGASPVEVIKGLNRSALVPTGMGGGYAEVPQMILDAGRAHGDISSAARDYLASASAGINDAVNPKQVQEDVATGKNITDLQVAGIQQKTSLGVAERQAGAGSRRYIEMKGGTDPKTFAPLPDRLFDTQTQTFVDGGAGQATAIPDGITPAMMRTNAIRMAKNSPATVQEINATLKKYGQAALTPADLSN